MTVAPVAMVLMPEAEFRAKLTRLDTLMSDVDGQARLLLARCERAVGLLPPVLSDALAAAITRLRELIGRFCTETAKIMTSPGSPYALIAAGHDWSARVGGTLGALPVAAAVAGRGAGRPGAAHWHGPAAEAYARVLPAQRAAITELAALAGSIDSNLSRAGAGLFALWAGVVLAVLTYLVELSAAADVAGTGVGAPAAAATAAAATAKAIGLVAALAGVFAGLSGEIARNLAVTRDRLG